MADNDILFRLEVDESGAVRGFRVGREELDKLKRTTQGTGAAARQGAGGVKAMGDAAEKTGRQAEGASTAARRLQQIIATVVTAATVRTLVGYADTMNELQARLRIVTDSQEEFNAAQEGTFRIAQETSTSLQATVELYARLELSLRSANVAQQDVLQVTETINKAMVVSGASVQEANAAIIQLSQGLAAGALRGDEFRSVTEQAPRVLSALQDALGKTRGELRELANEGKLTTEVIVQALLEQSAVIGKEFDEIPVTVGRAFIQLRNEILKFVADADDASQASQELAGFIVELSRNLDTILNIALGAAAGTLVVYIANAERATAATLALGRAVAFFTGPIGLAALAVGGLTFLYLENARAAETLQGALDVASGSAAGLNKELKDLSAAQVESSLETVRQAAITIEAELIKAQNALADFGDQSNPNLRSNPLFQRQLTEVARLEKALGDLQPRFNELRARQRELAAESAGTGDALGREKTAAELLAEALGESEKEAKKLADAIKLAEQAILQSGTSEQRVAVINKQYADILNQLAIELVKVAGGQELLSQAAAALTRQRDEEIQKIRDETDSVKQLNDAINDLIGDALDPATVALSQLEVKLEEVEIQFGANSEEARQAREAVNAARLEYEKLSQTEIKPPDFNPVIDALRRGVERLDDLFTGLWEDLIRGSKSAFDSIRDFFVGLLAELANAALTRPITLQIAAAIGGTGPGSVFANLGGTAGSLGSGAGLLGGLGALLSGPQIGRFFSGLPTFLGGTNAGLTTSAGGLFGAAGGVSNAAFLGSGLIGGILGQQIFGGAGGIGGGLGATIGTAIAPGIGSVIGGLLGGALGGLFGGGKPVLDITGTAAPREPKGDVSFFDTALGGFFARDRRIDDAAVNEFGQAIALFDDQIAQFLTGDQVDAASEALKSFELQLEGSAISLEDFLEARFDVVLGTLNDEIRAFVGQAATLEEQVERLRLATALEALLAAVPQLDVFENLSAAAAAFEELALDGEQIGDTFNRVAASVGLLSEALDLLDATVGGTGADFLRFSADFTTAAGGVDRAAALWQGFFETFFDATETLEAQLDIARQAARTEFADIGIDPNIGRDEFRELFESVLPTLSAEALAQWLEAASALGVVLDLEQQLTDLRLENASLDQVFAEQVDQLRDLINAYDGSADAQDRLISATRTLVDLMDDLQAAFADTRAAVNATIDSLVTDLRRETLSPEALFAEIRSEALARASALTTATSREEVAAIVNEITGLVGDARDVVGDASLNADLIAFLEQVREIANLRLGELEEQALAEAQARIDQVEAIFTFNDAVGVFADSVAALAAAENLKLPAGEVGPTEPEFAGLDVVIADGMAAGFAPFDSPGLQNSMLDFSDGVRDFVSAARTINTEPPRVNVNVNVTVDQSGNVTASEVSLA